MSERSAINAAYIRWIVSMAEEWCGPEYEQLLIQMVNTPFRSIVQHDENRISDGKELRERFVEESTKYTYRDMYLYLEEKECSILEVIVALIIRCDEQFLWDPNSDSPRGRWFRDILENLELSSMTNDNFDPYYVDYILTRLIERRYERDGKGGLFTIHSRPDDIRDVEIWYQAMWHLNETLDQ